MSDINVKIYLQGQHAIASYKKAADHISLTIGSKSFPISIKDFRPTTMEYIQKVEASQETDHQFSEVFNLNGQISFDLDEKANQPFCIEIRPESAELLPATEMLYLGVLWTNTMPFYDIIWEEYKSVRINRKKALAFCILLRIPQPETEVV